MGGQPSEFALCKRCGIKRQVRPSRPMTDLCGDCSVVTRDIERILAGKPIPRARSRKPKCAVCDSTDIRNGSCETCLRWAERDAERHGWMVQRRANRGRIWDVLAMREQARNDMQREAV